MPLLIRKRQIAIEEEGTEGSAETLVAADVQFLVEDVESSYTPEANDRNPMRETLSHEGVVIGAEFGEITGRTELKQRNSGDAVTTNPPMHDLYLAAGLVQCGIWTVQLAGAPTGTFRAGEHVTGDDGTPADIYVLGVDGSNVMTYALRVSPAGHDPVAAEGLTGDDSGATASVDAAPAITQLGVGYHPTSSSTAPSFTVGDYMDGVVNTIFGARANAQVNVGGVGQLGYLQFTAQGTADAPVDGALLVGVSIPNIVPEVFLSASVKVHGKPLDVDDVAELCVDSFTLDFANTLARRNCANKATGIVSYRITDRLPVINIDPERELEATIPFFTNFGAGYAFGFEATIGSTAGKKTWIVAARCQYTELPGADREGIAILNAALRCNAASTGGDDEFFIAHV